MIDHLNKIRREYLNRCKGLTPRADEIRKQLEIYSKSYDDAKTELANLQPQKEEAEKKEEDLSRQLMTTSPESIAQLEEERVRLEHEVEILEKQIEDLEQQWFTFLTEYSPLIIGYKSLAKTAELVGAKEEAGDIPPDYKKKFLKRLLESGRCICGTDLIKSLERRKKVAELLRDCDSISDISEELMTLYAKVGSMLEKLPFFREEQMKYGTSLKTLKQEKKTKIRRVEVIGEKIENTDVEYIKRIEQKKNKWKKLKEDLIAQIAIKTSKLERAKVEIDQIHKELRRELEKAERFDEIRKCLVFCDESFEAAKQIKEQITEQVRKEVEERTREEFFELIWKKSSFKDVKIDANYNVSVIHKSGLESIGTLSAGERQVLALSFMAALNSVSGFNVPIIIDTPLGRISKEPKESIARNLPNYLKDKQVTLLVTEEEYTPEVRERLAKRVSEEYLIQFDESESVARVTIFGD